MLFVIIELGVALLTILNTKLFSYRQGLSNVTVPTNC